jgi:hypothetical protein
MNVSTKNNPTAADVLNGTNCRCALPTASIISCDQSCGCSVTSSDRDCLRGNRICRLPGGLVALSCNNAPHAHSCNKPSSEVCTAGLRMRVARRSENMASNEELHWLLVQISPLGSAIHTWLLGIKQHHFRAERPLRIGIRTRVRHQARDY